uniref:Uncharacterized protein n=1 Tax=Meloidogyne enterolobii TaxID=390850 RepID=A0A6V7Y2F4_MELEN|nr:unnamed protein product [Meloidogyne enterolobii]
MLLFPIFIFLNLIYNVTSLSILVKILWRGNGHYGLQNLIQKDTHRFNLVLFCNKWGHPKEGLTDRYDTFHFEGFERNNSEELKKYNLKVFNQNVCLTV